MVLKTQVVQEHREYPGIDLFRIIAVVLVVMNHTYPLADISESTDFIFTRIIARIAVPFFFMVSGYFVLSSVSGKNKNYKAVFKSVIKLIRLYSIAILIYSPIYIYLGYISGNKGILECIKDLLFNGTFYHLWYLPAAIIGILLVSALLKKLSMLKVFIITILLYIIGLFGDSYYGVAQQIPIVKGLYNYIFMFFDYTRNGMFFAPLFLTLGAMISRQKLKANKEIMMYGFIGSLLLMIIEGLLLNKFQVQRHSSMYILLLPVMYFLFQWILLWKNRAYKKFRNISMIVYIIHPLMIILVRAGSKILNLQNILLDNNLIHFVVVLITSFGIAFGVEFILNKIKNIQGNCQVEC